MKCRYINNEVAHDRFHLVSPSTSNISEAAWPAVVINQFHTRYTLPIIVRMQSVSYCSLLYGRSSMPIGSKVLGTSTWFVLNWSQLPARSGNWILSVDLTVTDDKHEWCRRSSFRLDLWWKLFTYSVRLLQAICLNSTSAATGFFLWYKTSLWHTFRYH